MSVFTVDLANQPGELARLCEAMACPRHQPGAEPENGHGKPKNNHGLRVTKRPIKIRNEKRSKRDITGITCSGEGAAVWIS